MVYFRCFHQYKIPFLSYPKTIPGNNIAVRKAALFHSRPFMVLYKRAEKYPAIKPMNTYNMIAAVISEPLEDGDNIPNIAITETIKLSIPNENYT